MAAQRREMRRPTNVGGQPTASPASTAPVNVPAPAPAPAPAPVSVAIPAPAPRVTRVADPNLRLEELGGLDKARIQLLGAELEDFLDSLLMAGTLAPFPRSVVTSVQPRARGWIVATENGRAFGVRA